MKKIFLTAVALLTMATSVFGMYGPDSDWITFLTDGNRFRARLDQLGFTLGNDMIKGTFGFRNKGFNGEYYGGMLASATDTPTGSTTPAGAGFFYDFVPTISMGIGYTSSLISVGVGYNATIGNRWDRYNNKDNTKKVEAVAHTPVLVLNALDNAFRMAIPIQVVHLTDKIKNEGKGSVTAISLDAQFRYYTGLEMLPQIRLYLRYGMFGYNLKSDAGDKADGKFAESFGFDFRLYFGSMVEEVALQPLVKIQYNQALGKQHNNTKVTAIDVLDTAAANNPLAIGPTALLGERPTAGYTASWGVGAWDLTLAPALGLTANSDIVSLYVEPSLGLKITQDGHLTDKVKEVYGLGYGVYAEIYITPLKNLEWYFEAELGNLGGTYTGTTTAEDGTVSTTTTVNTTKYGLGFNATTGVTWYLPAL